MKEIMSLVLFFLIASSQADEACVKNAEKSPLYQAFKSCQEKKLKTSIKNFSTDMKLIDLSGKCTQCYYELTVNKQLSALCEDPNGFVCRQKGKVVDSDCKYTVLEPNDMMGVPSFAKTICDARDMKKPQEEKSAFIKAQIYSKERIEKMKKLYGEVKESYLKMLNESTRLSPENKKILKNKISNTRLALEPKDLSDAKLTDCHDITPTTLNTAIFNMPLSNGLHEVHICIGMMANFDYLNRNNLIAMISHELSHSIDPCVLENDAIEAKKPMPYAYNQFYSGTVQCLRGGSGTDGCTKSILNCNEDKGRMNYCQKYYTGSIVNDCYNQYKNFRPSCAVGVEDDEFNHLNLADYEKKGPSKDQIQEAFADFMAAENVARFLKNSKSETEKADTLLSMSSTVSRLHGLCLDKNTPDPHPPGFLRMNRINMSSKSFREAVGCMKGPPQTSQAKITCPGI